MNDRANYWLIAAGSEGRDYTQDFLRYGLAFVGGKTQVAQMARVKAGDYLILKQGMSRVIAVGRVVERDGSCGGDGDKPWLRDFDGWDLQAYRYVQWHVPEKPLDASGLTRGTILRIHKEPLQQIARDLVAIAPPRTETASEPPPTREVADPEILEFLIREGLRPLSAEELTAAFRRIRLLARYYYDQGHWADVREHETRTFLVMPLLLALGWAEQQMKIELGIEGNRRVDVACFRKPYRRDEDGQANNEDCTLIVETKDFSSGLDYAHGQAKQYAERFLSCRVVVVSNGYCYKAYPRRDDGSFSHTPSAYLNLLRPQDRYPLDPAHVAGALEMLRLLLPQSWS